MRFILPFTVLLAAACAPSVTITRDSSIPVYPHTTYAWGRADGTPTVGERDPRVEDPAVRARIEQAVDDELQRRGFQKSSFESAQLVVHYHIGVEVRVDTLPPDVPGNCDAVPCPPRYDWGYWGRPEDEFREVAYEERTLMLDFLARPSLKVAWRGVVREDYTPESLSEREIRRGVSKVLKGFPGKS